MIYPAAFAQYRQFVLYKAIPQLGGSIKKMPLNPHTLQVFPAGGEWQRDTTSFTDGPTATRLAALLGDGHGVGFLFTPDDPFFFVDIDNALHDGKWSARAQELLAWFAGCAVEVSVSGTGLHIFGSGEWPEGRRCKSVDNTFDIYTEWRFVALTGTHASGDAAVQVKREVRDLICSTFLKREQGADGLGWTTEPVGGYYHLDDEELIRKACRSSGAGAVFGGRATFADLWHKNERVLSRAYPADGNDGGPYDDSKADAALAQHLAFWTGRNCERIRQLMPQSGLVRDKYQRDDYMTRTIEGAVARQVDVYKGPDKRREEQLAEAIALGEAAPESHHTPILSLDQMLTELVFIGGEHAVGHVPTKRLRKKAAAADEYAASYHTYVDPDTRAEKSTPAFKAWLGNPKRLSVECASWWPGQGAICPVPEGHGWAFNTWRGLALPAAPVPDDWAVRVQPWVDHVSWLCGPDEALPFMQWLAHIVQRPAELPHRCYLHVTPTTGIGRNWMTGVLCRVLRGHVAAGVDIGKVLDGKFNGRLSQKLLACVDEVREGGDYNKRAVRAEKLKATVTEESREIDPKYGVQTIERNCCRWLMYSQHADALPFENTDRRVYVINNPLVRKSEQYYTELYARIRDDAFIASVWQYLLTLDLDGFNPSSPAVMTEAKAHALEAMASEVDFAVDEFKRVWPGDVAAFSQVKEFVGVDNDAHLRHALTRAGLPILPIRIRLPTGQRARVVVVRGSRANAEARSPFELRDSCLANEIKFRMENN